MKPSTVLPTAPTPTPTTPARSIFSNFRGEPDAALEPPDATAAPHPAPGTPDAASLQASIDLAIARLFLYRLLARLFEDPEPGGWAWLTSPAVTQGLSAATAAVGDASLAMTAAELRKRLEGGGYADFAATHVIAFGHTVRGECPMNEIEYGDIKADPLFQPHRLADLGAFFGAFGLEIAPDAAERIDHISIELEFMSVLAAKEAHALEYQFESDALATLHDAQRKFVREHLGRWSPAFARRLSAMAEGTTLGAAAALLGRFIQTECGRLHIPAGSEDLLLRPVDDAAERLCDNCGIHALPPGAARTGPVM